MASEPKGESIFVRKSKFAAENLVYKAITKGLRAAVFRVGVLTGRCKDGKFQRNIKQNAFYRTIKSLVYLRVIPISFLDQRIEFTPVDYCAKGIVKIIMVNQSNGVVFHMFNNRKLKVIELLSYFRVLDIPVQTLPDLKYNAHISRLSQTKEGKEILSGLVMHHNTVNYNNSIIADSTFTVNYLAQIGFSWPEIDLEYISKLLYYMHAVGFINKSIVNQ